MKIREYVDGLRQLADFVESHPRLFEDKYSGETVHIFADDREDMVEKALEMGKADKGGDGYFYYLRRSFGPHSLNLCVNREHICEKVQTGTRTVSVPDPKAVAKLPLIKQEEPIYEWVCPDSILQPRGY